MLEVFTIVHRLITLFTPKVRKLQMIFVVNIQSIITENQLQLQFLSFQSILFIKNQLNSKIVEF